MMMQSIPTLTRELLARRGITDETAMERFCFPDYTRDLFDPSLILNMDRAVTRILQAIREGERIVIYGDYDCDGIPGSVILHDFFAKIGYPAFKNYIPHRHHEGYGLNKTAIENFAREKTELLITVDCGITDVDEVLLAQSLGIDVIVTDHHLVGATLPPAYAIINSKQEGDTYPDPMLCGAAVAFKLVCALIKTGKFTDIPQGWEKWLLDMAGLSTIADMVPLVNENRALAYFGLKVLRKSPRPGLHALLAEAKVDQTHLTEEDIGFTIGPRINAASRMDVPFRAFELLATRDVATAKERARHLATLNDARKLEVARMTKEAKRLIGLRELREVIVIGNPKWRVGVAGIVANNLAETFDRPAFVWGKEDSVHFKGSCRSDGRVNIVELMHATREGIFLDKGGHEFSGGFSVEGEAIHFLEEALCVAHKTIAKNEKNKGGVTPDSIQSLRSVGESMYEAVNLLAPFGVGNPKPIFQFTNVLLVRVEQFGKERNHLKLIMRDEDGFHKEAIGFFLSQESFPQVTLEPGVCITLLATIEKSYFRSKGDIRLRIVDVQ